ncbi:neuromedin-B receptor isoform X4 [Syngnathus typhle]|uniref:neuromedin-B receptor isoform X4 n=1 Tax=Syngnathus typhle TaxID=161592 RepID=UPI002A6B1C11|nr:neuromedin-B receptor isoform X4 [Syngnathus typhle]
MADEFLSQLEAGNSSDDGAGGEVSSDGAYAAVRGVMTSAYTLIVLVGVLGNVTLVKIFVSTSAMRSVPNIFISSLAAGDLLLLVTCVPVDALRFFSEEWILGEVACKLLPAVQLTSVGVSVFTLTALSADRYKAIVKPMDIQASGAVLRTCAKAAAIWLLSVLLAVPEAIFSQVVSMQGQRGPENASFLNCVPYPLSEQTHPKVHAVMLFLVYFLFPLSIISVYYYHIARTLVRSARDMPGEVSEHTKKQMDLSLAHLVLTLLARILSFSSSCVNPFALYLLSDSFRRHFNSQLRCGGGAGGGAVVRPDRQASYLYSTSHVRLTSVKKAAPTVVIGSRQEA